jgi:hypothetical protein
MSLLENLRINGYPFTVLTNQVLFYIFKFLKNYWFEFFLNDISDFLEEFKIKGPLVQSSNSPNIIAISPGLPLISTYHQILTLLWISHLQRQIKLDRQILMWVCDESVLSSALIKLD